MKINKFKSLSVAVFCLIASLWSEARCSDNSDNIAKIGPTTVSKMGEQSVSIVNRELDDSGIIKIIKINPDVEILNLLNNNITDKGLKSISELKNVTFLNLSGNSGITFNGLSKMLKEGLIRSSLKTLHVNHLDEDGEFLLKVEGSKLGLKIYFEG